MSHDSLKTIVPQRGGVITDVIPGDEVNPDTLTSTIGMAIGALEGEAEAARTALDWNTIQVVTKPAEHSNALVVTVSARALA